MALITISRGSYSRGKEIAEKVAQKLGYDCISRDLLLEASKEFNIPEIKLIRAIHDAPTILEKFSNNGKEKYIAFFRATFLRHMQKENVVYHGLAGHFFLKGISHVLKVRIIADLEDRVRLEMERENISKDEAYRIINNDDEERRKWSEQLYGLDTRDPILYDIVINIRRMTVDNAIDVICRFVRLNQFQVTPESQKAMNELVLDAETNINKYNI